MANTRQGPIRAGIQLKGLARAIIAELRIPSGQDGPLGAAYARTTSALGHAIIGACAASALGGWGLLFGLVIALAYWLLKEWGDLTRGGALWDGLEDACMVWLGAFYIGPMWWPWIMLAASGYVMATGAWRK